MKKTPKTKNAFTLVEVLMASTIVALAVVSLLWANTCFTSANGAGCDLSTAEFLIEQIRELMVMTAVVDPESGASVFGIEAGETTLADYDDLDDFDGLSFCPPINARREALTEFSRFRQEITVVNVSDSNFEQVTSDHGSDFVKVTVDVFSGNKKIGSLSWIRTSY